MSSSMMKHQKVNETISASLAIGFVGGGNMAKSIAFPLFEKGLLNPKQVIVSATKEVNLELWKKYGCKVTIKNVDVVKNSSVVIWAVKPHVFPVALAECRKFDDDPNDVIMKGLPKNPLHISIMAGITLRQFGDALNKYLLGAGKSPEESISSSGYSIGTIRVMPNIGLKVESGVAVFSTGTLRGMADDRRLVYQFFEPLGLVYEVAEGHINAYTGLFGSGIGFMFPILEAMSDGAVKMGIPRARSLEIAAQVMKGAGELVLREKLHPGILKDAVCSPGGTTIAGVAELERNGVRHAVITAIEAATKRGDELGKLKQ